MVNNCIRKWSLGARDILGLLLLENNSNMETARKTWQPSHESPHPKETGTCHPDKQRKVEGKGRREKTNHWTLHKKLFLPPATPIKLYSPKAPGIWRIRKYNKTTKNWLQSLRVVNWVNLHLTRKSKTNT